MPERWSPRSWCWLSHDFTASGVQPRKSVSGTVAEPLLTQMSTGSPLRRLVPAAGAWRVQATHPPDGEHAQTYSTWRSFTVK